MLEYKYKIALKISHPSINPAEITTMIGMEPRITHTVGQPRHTPKGDPLEGVYRESYWFAELLPGAKKSIDGSRVEDDLLHLAEDLNKHKKLFERIITEGGRAYLDVATDSQTNYALILPTPLLLALSATGLTLVFDIYPYPQNW